MAHDMPISMHSTHISQLFENNVYNLFLLITYILVYNPVLQKLKNKQTNKTFPKQEAKRAWVKKINRHYHSFAVSYASYGCVDSPSEGININKRVSAV